MKVIILAAGYATRLWPLTLNKPKPLLPIRKRPILEYIINKAQQVEAISDIYIVTNTKFVKNFNQWKKGYKSRCKISVVDDGMKTPDERRGSIGDTIFTIKQKKIRSDLIVIAGDNLFDFSICDFAKISKQHKPFASVGLFDIGNLALADQYGIVKLNRNKKVVSFKEKPKKPATTLAAMCLYYFPREVLPLIRRYKSEGNPLDLAGSFISWLSKKESVFGYVFKGRWLDVGDKKSLKKAEKINWDRKE